MSAPFADSQVELVDVLAAHLADALARIRVLEAQVDVLLIIASDVTESEPVIDSPVKRRIAIGMQRVDREKAAAAKKPQPREMDPETAARWRALKFA